MPTSPTSLPVLAGTALLFLAYFATLHVLIVRGIAPWLSIGLIVGPWILALAATLRSGPEPTRRVRWLLAAVAAVALGLFGWTFGDRLTGRVDLLLFVENVVFLLVLSGVFARTLAGAREPLITHLARQARGGVLPPQAEHYTRGVTIVWAVFFATMALVSTLLFATQSRVVWSAFVNLSIWPSMALLFAVEYGVRLRVLRDIPHVPMRSGLDAFRQRHAEPVAVPGVHE